MNSKQPQVAVAPELDCADNRMLTDLARLGLTMRKEFQASNKSLQTPLFLVSPLQAQVLGTSHSGTLRCAQAAKNRASS